MTDENTVNRSKSRRPREPKPTSPAGEPGGTASDDRKSFDIDIFRAWCKSCGICAAFCPRHCIRLDEEGSPIVGAADECTGCGWCELHCPDFAISVHPRKHPSKSAEIED